MSTRREDFFKSALGSQAAVMNAWMLWKRSEQFTAQDMSAELSTVPLRAPRGRTAVRDIYEVTRSNETLAWLY